MEGGHGWLIQSDEGRTISSTLDVFDMYVY